MAEQKHTSSSAALAVTGVLKITVSDPPLTVQFTFEKSGDGDSWDVARLRAALQERKVKPLPEDDTLQAFLGTASRAAGPVNEVIMEGVTAIPPEPEQPRWVDTATPPELEQTQQEVLAQANPPEVFRTVHQQVEREKEVTRKGALGLSSTEKVTVTETVSTREKVFIDPTVIRSFWADENTPLGPVSPHTPGIPGRDVYGRTIPVRTLPDPGFYPGDGLEIRNGALVTTAAGFVRVGRNWADLVRWKQHTWSVELTPDRATCLLSYTPGSETAPPPDPQEILRAAEELEYPRESLLDAAEITALLEQSPTPGEPFPISVSRDGAFDIEVSEDRLTAVLNIHKGKGRGKRLTLREIGTAIRDSKLKNLDLEKIRDEITRFYKSAEMDLTGYVLSEGQAAVPGPTRQMEFAVTFDKPEKTRAQVQQFREVLDATDAVVGDAHLPSLEDFPAEMITKTAPVQKEQLICTFDPPTPGESGMDVYGVIIPGEPAPEPEIRLFENLQQKDVRIISTSGGVLDLAEVDGQTLLRVRPHQDASIAVEISPDRMTGYLSLQEGAGSGRRLSREDVDAALARAGVVYGLDDEVVTKALEAAAAGTVVRELAVATGTEPIHQTENQVEFQVHGNEGGSVRIRKDGTADFRNLNTILTVEKNQEICRILPSHQDPVEGSDVLGNAIPAQTVSGTALELGENVTKEELEDGTIVIRASIEGELLSNGKKLDIVSTHTVKGDVDLSVGNIRFPGSVLIGGTVRAGFIVIATGDIKIAGSVEGALLSSDGDIVIQGGVKGAGKAVLRSKQNIISPFVELATVLSVGNVVLKSALVRSRIKCNGRITFQGDQGRIVGGQIRARDGIEAESLGSSRGVRTHISFGQDYLIGDLIEKEEKEVEKIKQRISGIDREMRQAEREKKTAVLEKLRREKVKLLKLMEKRGLRLFTLRERFEQHFPSKVVVNGAVHSGTVFESHGRIYEVTSSRKGISVEFNPQTGNIDIQDLKDTSKEK